MKKLNGTRLKLSQVTAWLLFLLYPAFILMIIFLSIR
jgi:hypothetical protein